MLNISILLNGANEAPPVSEGLYKALISSHSGFRYLLLIALIIAIVTAYRGMSAGSSYSGNAKRFGLITMILTDLQLLMGLFLYYIYLDARTNFKLGQLKDAMSDSASRYFIAEHFIMMIIAIVLIHVGYAKAKKGSSALASNKAQFRWYLVALILILAAIPWPFYGSIGRGWF